MAVLDMGTILGRGTVAFDTKLGQPLGLRSLAGRALERCENPVGRPFVARQFRRGRVRQLRSFEATQPAGQTQRKAESTLARYCAVRNSALWWAVTVACLV